MKPKGDFPHLRYLLAKKEYFQYRQVMKTLESSLSFSHSNVARFRLHVLEYYYRWGLKPTLDAFGVKKSTLYDWKRNYEQAGKKLISLVPQSTRPHQTRRMLTHWKLVEFIKQMRKDFGNVGSGIIKPFLHEYAKKEGIEAISQSTIEKVIRRRGFTYEKRVNYRRKAKLSKLRVKHSPKVNQPGFIQVDSIIIYINQERHVFISIIDIFTKFALVEKVASLSSQQALKVFMRYQHINPTSINIVQTDNGSEFLASFHEYLEEQNITHQFIYPRLVKVNSFIERFNRTIQEEFIKRSDEIYYDLDLFQKKLVKYLYWYNYKRPHYSLKYMSPIQFINSQIPKSI